MDLVLLGSEELRAGDLRVSLMLTCLAVGIGAGSLAAGWLSGQCEGVAHRSVMLVAGHLRKPGRGVLWNGVPGTWLENARTLSEAPRARQPPVQRG